MEKQAFTLAQIWNPTAAFESTFQKHKPYDPSTLSHGFPMTVKCQPSPPMTFCIKQPKTYSKFCRTPTQIVPLIPAPPKS